MPTPFATHIVISAAQRAAGLAGASFYVRQRGQSDSGTLLVKVNNLAGLHTLFRQIFDGVNTQFLCVKQTTEESAIESMLTIEAAQDPDLWIIEIEDKESRLFIDVAFHKNA